MAAQPPKLALTLTLALLALALSACLPGAAPLPLLPTETPPPTATPTLTPTATPVWFPPTPTPTLLVAATIEVLPTLDPRPRLGEIQLQDVFDSAESWYLGRTPDGSTAISKGELTVAVSQPDGYVYSLRKSTTLANFYAEITASPSICRGGDEYGLLLRVTKALEFYRFALTCDGQARLDKYFGGKASSPQPLTFSGAIPPGAPSLSQIAVAALGKEMRFYANGELLFSVTDPSLNSGSFGVFARADGEDAITVNFSDLSVYQITGW